MTKGIIFDLYGTLLHTTAKKKPYLNLFRQLGLTKQEMSVWVDRVMTQNFNSLEELKQEIKPDSSVYTQQFEYEVDEEVEYTFLFDDTLKTLQRLRPKYRLFLLSNIATPYKNCYYNEGLDEFFEKAFFSCDIGFRKPQPESFQCIIEHSGLNPKQLLMIGDSIHSDYEGAMNIGIPALLKDKDLFTLTQHL